MPVAEKSRPDTNVSLIHDVPWDAYVALREELENRNLRMSYNQGRLQIVRPSKSQERLAGLLGRLVEVWTEQSAIEVQNCRSTTLRHHQDQRGLEPDNCFYIEHESQVRGRDEIDLSRDPPPDLAIEIELTSSPIDRMEIYAAIGVPEVWRWIDDQVQVYRFDRRGHYRRREGSLALPGFPFTDAERALGRRRTLGDHALVRSFLSALNKGRK
jgi:Uma2 family endonuclease